MYFTLMKKDLSDEVLFYWDAEISNVLRAFGSL